eukprot:TRINITY_DN6_c2_g1_i1.p1 TRINITY_DN6_c2_g1~~TRINITY_DN6_c2_g1_i1.p1  ORF type:complete len:345 (+),score=57.83 TRINITY_DN6_c2_g1_i1:129-1037(+)
MSSNGEAFDIGKCTVKALGLWRKATSDGTRLPSPNTYYGPTTEEASGNGSLMRIAPIPLAYRKDLSNAVEHAKDSSRTTHGGGDAVAACGIYTEMVISALNGCSKEEVLSPKVSVEGISDKLEEIVVRGSYKEKSRDDIRAGGWVIHALEAALWAFYNSTTFEQGALLCANLGDDTDTIAAIYGTLAGAHYSFPSIPPAWVATVAHPTLLGNMAQALYDFSETLTPEAIPWSPQHLRLEAATLSLLRRIRPGPRMYRTYEQYRDHVEEMKKEHAGAVPDAMLTDFVKVWERHDEKLKMRFGC